MIGIKKDWKKHFADKKSKLKKKYSGVRRDYNEERKKDRPSRKRLQDYSISYIFDLGE